MRCLRDFSRQAVRQSCDSQTHAEAALPLRTAAWGLAGQAVSGSLLLIPREIFQLRLVLLVDPCDRPPQPLGEAIPRLQAAG